MPPNMKTENVCMICRHGPTETNDSAQDLRAYAICCGEPICQKCLPKYKNSVHTQYAGCAHCRSTGDITWVKIDVFALEVVLCLNGNQQLLPITPRARRLFHRNTLSISQVNCGEWFGALAEHAVDAVKNFLPDIPRDKIMFCFTDANGET